MLAGNERKVTLALCQGLEETGFTVDICHRGDDAYELASLRHYDIIVLDITLPGRDGLSVLCGLRDKIRNAGFILLHSTEQRSECIAGLNLGADDCVLKPFLLDELIARVFAVLRRTSGRELSVLQSGDLTVDLITREVRRGKEEIELTSREFALLTFLMKAAGRAFTRSQLYEHAWNYRHDPGTNLVDVFIRRLRTKIGHDPARSLIETVRGVGYRFRKDWHPRPREPASLAHDEMIA